MLAFKTLMQRYAQPSTEIDDIDAPEPSPVYVSRQCSADGCRQKARKGGRHCKKHNTTCVLRHYARKKSTINQKRRAATKDRPEAKRAADIARAKLYVALSRGKLEKRPCVRCGRTDVTAYIAEPAQWSKVVWVCREDRAGVVEGIVCRERERQAMMEQRKRMEHGVAAFRELPEDVQAAIRDKASRAPIPRLGRTLTEDSPLFLQRLVTEVERLT